MVDSNTMNERLGDYELVRHLATGGMAEVFVARQPGPAGDSRELAIKRILPHLAREERFISMFLDEARIAARLHHPNIVEIYELGEVEGEYFIAMEFIDGGDLADLLECAEERSVLIPIPFSVRIIADILDALDHAHEFQDGGKPMLIVHRDVSPHNVLIGKSGLIKLVDFGIAHAVERHAKTETGLVKGKLSYMAPEQVEQLGVDRRADIFSAGALLYELITGEPPFGRELAAVNAILNEDPPDPRDYRPEVPEALVDVIYRALEKDPTRRFQTAREMHTALDGILRTFPYYPRPTEVGGFADALTSGADIEDFLRERSMPSLDSRTTTKRRAITPILDESITQVAENVPIPRDDIRVRENLLEDEIPVRDNLLYEGQPPHQRAAMGWFAGAAILFILVGAGVALVGGGATPQTAADVPKANPIEEMEVIELDPEMVEGDEELTFEDGEGSEVEGAVVSKSAAGQTTTRKRPKRRAKRRTTTSKSPQPWQPAAIESKPAEEAEQAAANPDAGAAEAEATTTPKPTAPKKTTPKPKPKKKKRNDLKIIDKAVPY